ncbi:DNA translocase FtsK 4TM domain-containing protein [Patescibacteria group bacterium]
MARKKKQEIKEKNLKEETIHGVLAVAFFVLAIFFILASFGSAGMVGDTIYNGLKFLFGVGYFLLPAILTIIGTTYLKSIKTTFPTTKLIGSILFFLSGLGIVDLLLTKGGFIGGLISKPLIRLFDFYTSLIFLFAVVIISLLVIFDTKLNLKYLHFWNFFKKKEVVEEEYEEVEEEEVEDEIEEEEEVEEKPAKIKSLLGLKKNKSDEEKFDDNIESNLSNKIRQNDAIFPPISLLQKDKGKPGVGDVKANTNIIKRALNNFNIKVEMDEVSIGPSVTRYALKPAEGVKLSRIVGLQNDLSLALAAHPLRIEAPIPGKSLVGIEIPNTTKTLVGLASLFASPNYQNSLHPLTIALGKDITGSAHFANLAKSPHLLIAGATGSGKSVTIHTLINSLLFRNSPEDLRLIMIDPKRVELTLYKNIPHLLTPVITDAKKAILALKWAVKEMERRYDILESESVRDIQSYHKNIVEPALSKPIKTSEKEDVSLPEKMPYIVVIIDELADIMQAYPRELEAGIVRLAQMSRAVGIHLVLSTQRPSVNVITGLIKANVPSRIALQVASQIDSRTILDMAGAEKLLGAGDMLYMSGEMSKPIRIQSAFISEKEVKDVVKFLVKSYESELPDEIDLTSTTDKNSLISIMDGDDEDEEVEDELYEDAKNTIIEAGKASTSYLQRKLRIGYARAARLMDILEDRGIIGPSEGSKPREVLVNNGDLEESDEYEEYEEESIENEEKLEK